LKITRCCLKWPLRHHQTSGHRRLKLRRP
jgi:hypothetical protein